MAKVTDNRLGIRVDIDARKGADFHRRFHAQYYSGTTLVNIDFNAWDGATMQIRRKPNSPITELSFSTTDGSIVLAEDGRFDLILGYEDMDKIRGGDYDYDMYLTSTTYPKRDFMYGTMTIEDRITH